MLRSEDMLTVQSAAHIAGCHPNTIRAMIRSGEITAIRVGSGRGRLVVPRPELWRRMASRFTAPALQAPGRPALNLAEYWHTECGDPGPVTPVELWVAEGTLQFWAAYPEAVLDRRFYLPQATKNVG